MEYKKLQLLKPIEVTSLISAFNYQYKKNYYYKGETHDFWEFTCVLEGTANIAVDNKIYKIEKNNIMFIKPNQFHNLSTMECDNLNILIMSLDINISFDVINYILPISQSQIEEILFILNIGKTLFDFKGIFVKSTKTDNKLILQTFISNLELFIIKVLLNENCNDNKLISTTSYNYTKIIDIMKNNLNKKLLLSDIAKLSNMSESNVKKTFSMYTKDGIINYFNALKLASAKLMLRNNKSIKEISQSLGFIDQNYFSNLFKKHTGLSPKNWLIKNP